MTSGIKSRPYKLSKSAGVNECSVDNCVPLLIQQNIDRSNVFNRSWAEYKVGFNDSRGNYWLGNDLLSQLTLTGSYKLRIDLQGGRGSWYYAEYSTFIVQPESDDYRMHLSGYLDGAGADVFSYGNCLIFSNAGGGGDDELSYQSGQMFSSLHLIVTMTRRQATVQWNVVVDSGSRTAGAGVSTVTTSTVWLLWTCSPLTCGCSVSR